MEPNKELEQAIENKFLTPSKFAMEIEKIVAEEQDFNYIDAICYYCETNNIEVESVSKLISKPLKERLKRSLLKNRTSIILTQSVTIAKLTILR